MIHSVYSSLSLRPALFLACLVLAGCGGGGGGGGSSGPPPPPANRAPVANAGADLVVAELTTVNLNGSGTDADGDALTFQWSQVSGDTVTLSNANQASASFTAPDVPANAPVALIFRLTVRDPSGAQSTDDVRVIVQEPGSTVTVSGTLKYEYVPANGGCSGLNYNATQERPIRGATVQLLDGGNGAVLDVTVAGPDGSYAFTTDPGRLVRLRVRSELKQIGTPGWDVDVRNNTASTGLPLASRPLYVLDGQPFDTGVVDQTRDLTAATGWTGNAYTEARAAAPFAILDAIYTAMELVLAADPQAVFEPLDAFWSVNNTTARASNGFDTGEIGTSFYRGDLNSLFLLGKENDDTEEFDSHVIVHEWGHYFEDAFSRSDSIGGAHGAGDRLDMRVAFGEGFATALAGIALQDINYCDTGGPQQSGGFRINIENSGVSARGWWSEFSVLELIYDLWDDSPVELTRGDTGTLDFAAIYDTMVGPQRLTAAHTSVFSFIEHLAQTEPAAFAPLQDLKSFHDINGTGIHGDGETNDGGGNPNDALPVYTDIQPDGTPVNICSNREHEDSASQGNVTSHGNRLSEHRFLRMSITVPARYEFDIVTDANTVAQLPPDDPNNVRDQSDPDIFFWRDGVKQNLVVNGDEQGTSGVANRENFTTPNTLPAGDYVLDVVEFRHRDNGTDQANFPARSCFDITIRQAP